MKKPNLDTSAGVFTNTEFLSLLYSDLSSTTMTEDNGDSRRITHPIDYDAQQCLTIVKTIDQCNKAPSLSANIIKQKFPLRGEYYKVSIQPELVCFKNNNHTIFQHEFSDKYIHGPEIQAWLFVRKHFKFSELETLSHFNALDLKNKEQVQYYVDLFNKFFTLLVNYLQSSSYKRKIRDRNFSKRKNKKSSIELVHHFITKYAKVLVIRMDFSFKRDIKTIIKHASSISTPYSHNDLDAFKKCMANFKRNWRNNGILSEIKGYIFQYEYSSATGFHVHAYFFFDGNKHQEDISLAQYISEYWKKVTNNLGSTFICNMKKEQYRYCGIGMIHYSDIQKQEFLIRTFDYIFKADQFFIFSGFKKFKRFHRSRLPIPKARSGRSRSFHDQTH